MKKVWYKLVHIYVNLCLHFYFNKIIVYGKENIPKNGPVIFLANHQNALLDALLIATTNSRYINFLARADLFKKAIVRWFISTLNLIPVYRIRDGWSSLNLNAATFDRCEKVLKKGEALLLFPEGNHDLKRRLRPLSKGFTRIVDQVLKNNPSLDLKIIPVGINYEDHQAYWRGVSLYYGTPITAREFVSSLKEKVSQEIKNLIVHVDDLETYEAQIEYLKNQKFDFLDPHRASALLKQYDPKKNTPTKKEKHTLLRFLKFIFTPLLIFHVIPVVLWSMMKKRIKDPVFVGTARFAFGIVLVPLSWVLGVWVMSYYVIEPGTIMALVSLISLPLYAMLTSHFD